MKIRIEIDTHASDDDPLTQGMPTVQLIIGKEEKIMQTKFADMDSLREWLSPGLKQLAAILKGYL